MITNSQFITADNTDVFQGTDLQNVGPGVFTIYIASTQNDTVFTFTGPDGPPMARLVRVPIRTNGQPALDTDVPYSYPTLGGKHVLNVDIVTAATVGIVALFTPEAELT